MYISKSWPVTVLLLAFMAGVHAQDYKNRALPIEIRVRDLLSRMTPEEKAAQLRSTWSVIPRVDEKLLDDPRKMDSLFGQGLGMINPDFDNTPEQQVAFRNRLQHYFRTKTRLGIPVIFLDEAHHGLLAQQVDVFPTSIGLACSWDTALVSRIYAYVARQVASRGGAMVLAPVVDVTRDPRWGRTGETYGEDPFLCGMMGAAAVRGLQGSGDGRILAGHVAATLKHLTGHGQPIGGVNQGPADYSERTLREFHMEPFRLVIAGSKPAGLMAAYVDIDGIPCHANRWLLNDVLRGEWGYHGLVVSDWWGIDQLYQKHRVAADKRNAALQAFQAGVTVDLPMGANYAELPGLVRAGKIRMEELDNAVGLVLRLKFKLGLFDDTMAISLDAARAEIGRPAGRELALKAAEESIVLLKNDPAILPLDKNKLKKIAVIGPCAAIGYTGDYSGVPVHSVSILEGIRRQFSGAVVYGKGVDFSRNEDSLSFLNSEESGLIVPPDAEHNRRMIDSAVQVARDADVIVCAIGENEQYSRESEGQRHLGDESDLNLPAGQDELVRALAATGKPVILCLLHGRPRVIGEAVAHARAVLDGWYAGEEEGNAFARILFGEVCPSGKLTISIPRSVGQLPVYYNHKPGEHFFPYVQEKATPLYPFGFGLSYTTFRYSGLRVDPVAGAGPVVARASVEIMNTGNREGDEIVQLYVHPKLASVTRPVKTLKGFRRVTLKAGEMRTVSFGVTREMLSYWDREMRFRAEAGEYEVMVGGSSAGVQTVLLAER